MKKAIGFFVIVLVCFAPNVFSAEVLFRTYSSSYDSASGLDKIHAITGFNDNLFMAAARTSGYTNSGRINKLVHAGCNIWDNVTPIWSPDAAGSAISMVVFNNHLYVGNGDGDIFRTPDGMKWENVTGDYQDSGWIYDMAEFSGELYFIGAGIWRTQDHNAVPHVWEQVWAPEYPNELATITAKIESLEPLNGFLYAGVGNDAPKGIAIWKSSDGMTWEKDFEETSYQAGLGHVHAMKPYNGHQYVGLYHGSGFIRTDGSDGIWDWYFDALDPGSGDPYRLLEHNGNFYAGTASLSITMPEPDKPLLYFTSNGTEWNPVPEGPTASNDIKSVTALEGFDEKIYLATKSGIEGRIAIYQLGPEPAPTCRLAGIESSLSSVYGRIGEIRNIIEQCTVVEVGSGNSDYDGDYDYPPCFYDLLSLGQAIIPLDENWVFPMLSDIFGAVEKINFQKKAEEMRMKVFENLEAINIEIMNAMSLVFFSLGHDTNPIEVFEEAIGGLENALTLCDQTSTLLTIMQPVIIDGCETNVLDWIYSDKHITEWIDICEANAKNHGSFVRCVSRLTNELKKFDEITGKEKGAIQRCAARAVMP